MNATGSSAPARSFWPPLDFVGDIRTVSSSWPVRSLWGLARPHCGPPDPAPGPSGPGQSGGAGGGQERHWFNRMPDAASAPRAAMAMCPPGVADVIGGNAAGLFLGGRPPRTTPKREPCPCRSVALVRMMSRAFAKAAGASGRTRRPAPAGTVSGTAPARQVTMGWPQAIASSKMMP